MPVNLDKPQNWKTDIAASVDMYNQWFINFAPEAFRETRIKATKDVESALADTANLTDVTPDILRQCPGVLPTLRMSTCPPLAVDRLIGLAGVSPNLVKNLEQNKLPARMKRADLDAGLTMIGDIIEKMADPDIFVWIGRDAPPAEAEIHRAATIVADRLCGSVANPIIRNAQERRQLAYIAEWLESRGYTRLPDGYNGTFREMSPGTYSFRMNVPVGGDNGSNSINIPVDAVIMRQDAQEGEFPLLVEAKSAGDFTNTNKRRKEEAQKVNQLRHTYGADVEFMLFLCGYFDSGYLGYEAAEGIDWVWEHRIDDFQEFGL
ncbi:XamI family restriction endonuclease [Thioalkalivibrio sp. ALMg13-2]|uniref:XamI family restriction endonuclease n=1 Tax=Thioalkalivibrio sp. ALMg13-2 TaxID=1158167 RepID=UPI00037D6A77|nr:XamI family restriction endonuclease [Thioalkalivibrio sp. ALMg13-2]